MEKIVLTQEELNEINKVSQSQKNLIETFGFLEYQIQDLELQKLKLVEDMKMQKSQEVEVAKKINEKYGEGTININTGEFIKTN